MQALAERLDAALVGSTLVSTTLLQFSALKTVVPAPEDLVDRTITGISRRGKYLIWGLDGPRMLVHLSQGGRVDLESPPKTTRPRAGVVRLAFGGDVVADGSSVLVKEWGTERKAGWWVLADGDEGPLARLGPEPDSSLFRSLVLESTDHRRVHTILRDQRTVAGIGRGYSDDILHAASVSPYAALKSLDAPARERLLAAVNSVLARATEVERQRSGGLPTKLGTHFMVHGKAGEPCPTCGADLRRVSYESYEVAYCPDCQTGGKVLADRRLSKIVR